MTPKSFLFDIGIGATKDLSLRVSVASLVRVLFEHPKSGEWMLALERKATLFESENGQFVELKVQPFGGAIQIRDLGVLRDLIGDFHFDSEKSRSEQDFRLFIRPSAWETLPQFCLDHFSQDNDSVLESDPSRELTEEFADALEISLRLDQFAYKPSGVIIENEPSPTENIHARGYFTARIYRIFEAHILDTALTNAMLTNTKSSSNRELHDRAVKDARKGGEGRANAVLALPLKQTIAVYSAVAAEVRNGPISYQNHQLDETVAAVLDGVTVPKYRRL
jgi:hypothetical protein